MLLGILLCIAFSHLILPRAGAAAAAAANCRRTCGSSTVPYPFGFSAGCGIRLTCNSTNSILVAETYPVWNITPDSLLLDVAPSCDRPVRAAIGVLFGPNYAMTWRNGLFLRNCTATAAASRCLLPTSLATQISQRKDLASCGEKGDNITCYSSGRTDGFLSPGNATASGCGYVFTSVLYSPGGGDEGAQMPAIVFGAAELGWWLNGPCRCSANATCAPVAVPGNATGFRCSCDAGFVGDGFADGDGCVRGESVMSLLLCGWLSNQPLNFETEVGVSKDYTIKMISKFTYKMMDLTYLLCFFFRKKKKEELLHLFSIILCFRAK